MKQTEILHLLTTKVKYYIETENRFMFHAVVINRISKSIPRSLVNTQHLVNMLILAEDKRIDQPIKIFYDELKRHLLKAIELDEQLNLKEKP